MWDVGTMSYRVCCRLISTAHVMCVQVICNPTIVFLLFFKNPKIFYKSF